MAIWLALESFSLVMAQSGCAHVAATRIAQHVAHRQYGVGKKTQGIHKDIVGGTTTEVNSRTDNPPEEKQTNKNYQTQREPNGHSLITDTEVIERVTKRAVRLVNGVKTRQGSGSRVDPSLQGFDVVLSCDIPVS